MERSNATCTKEKNGKNVESKNTSSLFVFFCGFCFCEFFWCVGFVFQDGEQLPVGRVDRGPERVMETNGG